jgi:cytidine deaminase
VNGTGYNTELTVDVVGPRKMIVFSQGGNEIFAISETVVTGWLVIIILFVLIKFLTSDLKVKPTSKRQVLAEWCGADFRIFLARSAEDYRSYTLDEIMPLRFGPENLR